MTPQNNHLDQEALAVLLENSIKSRVLPLSKTSDELLKLLISEYKLDDVTAKKILENDVLPFLDHLKPALYVVIETPYVDKLYRDSYYIFYSSKHLHHYRDTIRLSFFNAEIKESV